MIENKRKYCLVVWNEIFQEKIINTESDCHFLVVYLFFQPLVLIFIAFPEIFHTDFQLFSLQKHLFDHIIQSQRMALHRLFSFLIGSFQLVSQPCHFILQKIHFFNNFPLLLTGFRYLAVHHPGCFLDFLFEFAYFICKVRKLIFEDLFIGFVVNDHFCLESIDRLQGSLFGELNVLGEISVLFDFGLEHVLEILYFLHQHFSVTSELRDVFLPDYIFHLVYHPIHFKLGLLIHFNIAFHISFRVTNSLLNLLQPMHHHIEIIMNDFFMSFYLLLDVCSLWLIPSSKLLIYRFKPIVKL